VAFVRMISFIYKSYYYKKPFPVRNKGFM